MTHLAYLGLGLNYMGFEGGNLPDATANLADLEQLDLRLNCFTSLPNAIMLLPKLATLDVSDNYLCDVGAELQVWLDARDPDWRETQTNPNVGGHCVVKVSRPIRTFAETTAILNGHDAFVVFNPRGRVIASEGWEANALLLPRGLPNGTYVIGTKGLQGTAIKTVVRNGR
jgi:hypothetical protein